MFIMISIYYFWSDGQIGSSVSVLTKQTRKIISNTDCLSCAPGVK